MGEQMVASAHWEWSSQPVTHWPESELNTSPGAHGEGGIVSSVVLSHGGVAQLSVVSSVSSLVMGRKEGAVHDEMRVLHMSMCQMKGHSWDFSSALTIVISSP